MHIENEILYYKPPEWLFSSPNAEVIIVWYKDYLASLIIWLVIYVWIIIQMFYTKNIIHKYKAQKKNVSLYLEMTLRLLVVIIMATFAWDWFDTLIYRINNGIEMEAELFPILFTPSPF